MGFTPRQVDLMTVKEFTWITNDPVAVRQEQDYTDEDLIRLGVLKDDR